MKPEFLQNISNIFVLVGLILAALGGFGSYYYGKIIDDSKDLLINQLNVKVENQTKDIIGFSRGEESPKAYFKGYISTGPPLTFNIMFVNESKYPVFDIVGEWIDLDVDVEPENIKIRAGALPSIGTSFIIEQVYPGKVMMGIASFDFSGRNELRLRVFANYRSGQSTAEFRVFKVGNTLKIASQVVAGEYTNVVIPEDFPSQYAQEPEKLFGDFK